jgi:hypothetical protein
VAGLDTRSVLAEADAFDATVTAADFEEHQAPDAGPWLDAATAAALVPTLGVSASATQDSAFDGGALAAALTAEALGQSYHDTPPASGTGASESYARWIFQVDASGTHRLEARLAATTIALGDAFASLALEEVVLGAPSVVLADWEAGPGESIELDWTGELEAGSIYQLTLLALAVVQMDPSRVAAHGLATLETSLVAVPEPAIPVLWATAFGLAGLRRTTSVWKEKGNRG